MTPAEVAFRIALSVILGFALFAATSLIRIFVRARFPLLGIRRHAETLPEPRSTPPAAPAPESKPRPETVRAVGSAVLVGENPRNRLVLK